MLEPGRSRCPPIVVDSAGFYPWIFSSQFYCLYGGGLFSEFVVSRIGVRRQDGHGEIIRLDTLFPPLSGAYLLYNFFMAGRMF
jgi:hypothetical protein